MSNSLKLQLVLDAINKASAPLKKMGLDSSKAAKKLKESRDALRELDRQQRDITGFKKTQEAVKESSRRLSEAREKTEALRKQLSETQAPTARMVKQFQAASKASQALEKDHTNQRKKLVSLNAALSKAGISTRNLDQHQAELKTKTDQLNTSINDQVGRLKRLAQGQQRLNAVRQAGNNVLGEANKLALQGTVAATGIGVLFKTQFLDTASQFEDLEAVLRTVEGSSEKARVAMQWTSDFAAKTPYELAEVTEAYKQLRAYGLDPTSGLLQDLGDTAAAMNKPIMQAVEAIADAVTGENERLKEFGIRASKAGGQITYEYTNKAGEQKSISVAGDSRKEIEATLRTIWNEKYKGAMDERSKTWSGMMSNMSDHWARFTNMVMGAGLFDWMKDRLGTLLGTIDQMAKDGRLQKLAKEWGQKLVTFATGAWKAGTAIVNLANKVADLVGGWENLIIIVAALKLAGLISSVLSLGSALFTLGATYLPVVLSGLRAIVALLIGNPIGLIITGIAAAAFLVYKYWDPIKDFFKGLWNQITTAFDGGIAGITALLINWSPYGLLYSAVSKSLDQLGIELPEKFSELGEYLIDGLLDGIESQFPRLWDMMNTVSSKINGWFKDDMEIHSPSRVFVSHGSNIMRGLEKGLEDNRTTLRPLMAVSNKVKQAGAGLALGSMAMGAVAMDNRPPLQAHSASGAGTSVSVGAIHVHAAPGMDEAALARLVAAEITRLQHQQAASRRSNLSDED